MMRAELIGLPTGVELHEQFETVEQQRHAAELGMWGWLVTELLLFGGLFVSAVVLHYMHPDDVRAAASHLKLWIGATNSFVLICSSLTMSGAIVLSRLGGQRWMVRCMLATAALGTLFLVLKSYEYYIDYNEHMMPFLPRPFALADKPGAHLFVDLYYVTTSLHAFHLITGIGILLVLTRQASRDGYLAHHQNRIEIYGLYWHFIDLIWILVFPVLYVVGR